MAYEGRRARFRAPGVWRCSDLRPTPSPTRVLRAHRWQRYSGGSAPPELWLHAGRMILSEHKPEIQPLTRRGNGNSIARENRIGSLATRVFLFLIFAVKNSMNRLPALLP